MSKLTVDEMLAMRAAGKTSREIAEAAGISHTAVNRRLRRADKAAKGPQDADSLKQAIMADLDVATLTNAQKLSALRTLSKSRKRGVRGSLESECEKYVAAVAGKTFTKGAPPITEEAARKFFTEVMTGTWKAPDMSKYRLPEPETPSCSNCGSKVDPTYRPDDRGWCVSCVHLYGGKQ